MMSRARSLAAVTLLIGCLAASAAWGQATNLEAGKSASQLFAGTCTACHKSPRGLLKTVSPGSLSGFLRDHYTTSSGMASELASYLVSNGASDRQAKQGSDKDKQGAGNDRKMRNAPAQEAARPDDGVAPADSRQGRRRQARPGEPAEEPKPVANAPAAVERGPDGRRLKQRRGRPGDEPPMAKDEPPKAEPGANDRGAAKEAVGDAKPADDSKSNEAKSNEAKTEPVKTEPAKMDAPKTDVPKDSVSGERAVVRRDPVPPVTPAPAVSAPPPAASTTAPPPAVASTGSSEQTAPRPPAPAAEPPAMTASAPPPAPSAGPPVPPISQ